jgi:pimeloyl-ACP methyl ester carboxylesterase
LQEWNVDGITVTLRKKKPESELSETIERPPNPMLMALEARAPWEWGSALAAWPLLRMMGVWPRPAQGAAHHVIVYPGLAAGDVSTQPLRAFLEDMGYQVHGWYQGMNRGPGRGVLDRLREQLNAVYRDAGAPVSLIGWSLGGVYAREMAKELPKHVCNVITLGTPFAQSPRATNAWRVYSMLSSEHLPDTMMQLKLAEAPPVPTTSIYSKSDGVVAWAASIQKSSKTNTHTENVEVFASHLGIGVNPAAWYVVADRLALASAMNTRADVTPWEPFEIPAAARFLFGK